MCKLWVRIAIKLGVLTLFLASGSVFAQELPPCDFVTGGGFIITTGGTDVNTHAPAKANFGVGGGCKDGSPTFGHLEYIDHGNGLNVHWTSITAYIEVESGYNSRGKPIGVRGICGKARTNLYGDVDFLVQARDAGEPGVNDEFDIRLARGGVIVYSTEFFHFPHKLNDGNGGGGNIQLHEPNPSTTGNFSELNSTTCPAFFASPPGGPGPGA